MIKSVKPIPIGPILLISFGVILIIGGVIWEIMLARPPVFSTRPQSGPAPTLAVPHTNIAVPANAYYQGKVVILNSADYSGKYLDFS